MKKCLAKLFSLLFIAAMAISPAYGVSFRNALQIPCDYICKINDDAKCVNFLPEEELDITLNGERVGKRFGADRDGQPSDSILYAFKKTCRCMGDVLSLQTQIQSDIDNNPHKEFIFTGYGKGANSAANVVARLQSQNPNQIKIIVFCAESKIYNALLSHINMPCMYLSDKLHFCKRDEEPCYDSSVIECNMSPTITERFSAPKCAAGVGGLVGVNLLLDCIEKGENKSQKKTAQSKVKVKAIKEIRKAVNIVGGVAAAAFSFSKQQGEYFSSDEIGPRFERAKHRMWGADGLEDWYHLGDRCFFDI